MSVTVFLIISRMITKKKKEKVYTLTRVSVKRTYHSYFINKYFMIVLGAMSNDPNPLCQWILNSMRALDIERKQGNRSGRVAAEIPARRCASPDRSLFHSAKWTVLRCGRLKLWYPGMPPPWNPQEGRWKGSTIVPVTDCASQWRCHVDSRWLRFAHLIARIYHVLCAGYRECIESSNYVRSRRQWPRSRIYFRPWTGNLI